jgi:predicted O-methyltransferase YrrM
MTEELWSAVDAYYSELLMAEDTPLDSVLEKSSAQGLPAINVAPNQGKFLMLLAMMCKAKRILEIGTLGGYSTIWLAKALPSDGKLITLEFEEKHAAVARENILEAGLQDKIEVIVGSALDTLPKLIAEKCEPFDFIFIDADKVSYSQYFELTLQLARAGTTIVADNVVRNGAVIDPESRDEMVCGVRKFNNVMAAEKRVSATALQTVGSKGYDGFAIAVVTA